MGGGGGGEMYLKLLMLDYGGEGWGNEYDDISKCKKLNRLAGIFLSTFFMSGYRPKYSIFN